jgi:hypothetical protein
MSLVPSTANSDGWVQIPCELSNGVSISKPILLNFDSGAQLSAIGVSTAKQIGVSQRNIVGRLPVQSSIGTTNLPVAELVISIAGGPRFRTRMIIDNESGYNGVIGRNDLNSTHSICFDKNGAVQLTPLGGLNKVASASPIQRWGGTVNGVPVTFLFDTGAVGPVASSAISQQVANAARVTNFVGTQGVQGVGSREASTGIAMATLTINGSPPFQTYVDVDPQLTEQALISRQDITRVARVCVTPGGYTFSPFASVQMQPQVTPMSLPRQPTQAAPETSPNPRQLRPIIMPTSAQSGQNVTLLIVGAGGLLVLGLGWLLLAKH